MAVSISFGLIAATVLTLIFVPALYVVIVDIIGVFMAKEESSGTIKSRNGKRAAVEMNESKNILEKGQ
jgi:hypothetical protein